MEGIRQVAESQSPLLAAAAASRTAKPAAAQEATAAKPLPASPPPEVHDALDVAAQVIRELEAQKVDLHFEMGPDHKVRIELRDNDGAVIREIPAAKVAEMLAGDLRGLAVDAKG
jgi:hypothetical protein